MLKLIPLFLGFLLVLTGCGQDLHFKIRFDEIDGLKAGDPLVLDDQAVGEVLAVESAEDGGHLASVAVERKFAGTATVDSSFYLAEDPEDPARKRIEIVQSKPGGQPLAEGSVVEGSYPSPFGLFPFGSMLKEFGKTLRDLREQVERFRQDFDKIPDSEEARKLQQEWRKLLDEIRAAQEAAEGSLKKELLPKLREELENIRKKLEELEETSRKKGKPLET